MQLLLVVMRYHRWNMRRKRWKLGVPFIVNWKNYCRPMHASRIEMFWPCWSGKESIRKTIFRSWRTSRGLWKVSHWVLWAALHSIDTSSQDLQLSPFRGFRRVSNDSLEYPKPVKGHTSDRNWFRWFGLILSFSFFNTRSETFFRSRENRFGQNSKNPTLKFFPNLVLILILILIY